jgi:hypothetical protein
VGAGDEFIFAEKEIQHDGMLSKQQDDHANQTIH